MPFARSLLVMLCAAQAGDAAFAATAIAPLRSDVAPVVEPVARKGTRAYRPDGAAPAVDNTQRVKVFGKLAQGLSLGYLGLLYDRAFIFADPLVVVHPIVASNKASGFAA